MQKSIRYIMTVLVLGSFLLSACAGAAPQGDDSGGNPDANSNEVIDVNGNANDNGSNVNENGNDAQDNGNDNGDDLEFHGVVDAITDKSIVIDGVEYSLADFTEIKDLVSVGDQVKIHVIVNADGTFTIREIELSSGIDDNSNGNSNGNSNSNDKGDDNNSNSNSNNDDKSDDNSKGNSNDNDKGDDNSNDD